MATKQELEVEVRQLRAAMEDVFRNAWGSGDTIFENMGRIQAISEMALSGAYAVMPGRVLKDKKEFQKIR